MVVHTALYRDAARSEPVATRESAALIPGAVCPARPERRQYIWHIGQRPSRSGRWYSQRLGEPPSLGGGGAVATAPPPGSPLPTTANVHACAVLPRTHSL